MAEELTKEEKPCILFVVNVAWFFVSHRLPIAIAAQKAGYDVHVAAAEDSEVVKIRQANITFHSIPLSRSGVSLVGEMRSLIALFRLYRTLRPYLVHHITIKPVIYGGMIARLLNVPAVVNAVPGLGYVFSGKGIKIRILRECIKNAYRVSFGHHSSRVIFQNPADRDLFLKSGVVKESQVIMIPGSGVDLGKFVPQPEPEGIPIVILASRLLWDKGVGEFVEAATCLKIKGVKARFVLVGNSDTDNPGAVPESNLVEWQNTGIIEWWGYQQEMEKVFSSTHLVCLPSYYKEGMPKVLLEAAACGRAIITTDMPGCRDTVENGESGLLVPGRDSQALAYAMECLICDSDKRQQFGKCARNLAEKKFSLNDVIEKTLALYDNLCERKMHR